MTKQDSKIIAVASEKGGVGKTTIAMHLASNFAEINNNKRVLLIDLDCQASATQQLTGRMNHNHGIYDVFTAPEITSQDVIVTTNWQKNLWVCPADRRLSGLEAMLNQPGIISKETMLKQRFGDVMRHFDYVVIDTPPRLEVHTTNALSAADYYLIPASLSTFSMRGMERLLELVSLVKKLVNPELKSLDVVINQQRKMKCQAYQNNLDEIKKHHSITGFISDSVEVEKAEGAKTPISLTKSKIASDFKRLTLNIMDKMQ